MKKWVFCYKCVKIYFLKYEFSCKKRIALQSVRQSVSLASLIFAIVMKVTLIFNSYILYVVIFMLSSGLIWLHTLTFALVTRGAVTSDWWLLPQLTRWCSWWSIHTLNMTFYRAQAIWDCVAWAPHNLASVTKYNSNFHITWQKRLGWSSLDSSAVSTKPHGTSCVTEP